jgi:DnaK suppressor protein
MTINIDEMRKRLLQRKREILGSEGDLSEAMPKVVDPNDEDNGPYDIEDNAVDVTEDQQEQVILADDQELVAAIDAALQRIKDGTYGKCLVDGKPIPEKRLQAIPWAAYCIQHEEQLEQQKAAEEDVLSHDSGTHFS